jgi:hypothetical protein
MVHRRFALVSGLLLAAVACDEPSASKHEACCACLRDKDLYASGTTEDECRQQLAVNDDDITGVESKCLVFDNCGTECDFWTRPAECGTAAGCCGCVEGRHWQRSGADAGPCMDTTAAACTVRVSAGQRIPLSSTSQETVDQCLIDACRQGCKGYPPSP